MSTVIDPSDPCGKHIVSSYSDGYPNLTISTSDDVETFSKCSDIGDRNLVIEKSFVGIMRLPTLHTIRGGISVGDIDDLSPIGPSTLTGLSFPNLIQSSDIMISNAASLVSLDFPSLEQIVFRTLRQPGGIFLDNLPCLTSLKDAFPNLRNASTVFINNTSLEEFNWDSSFPILSGYRFQNPGEVVLTNNTNLDYINLTTIQSTFSLKVWGNGKTNLYTGNTEVRRLSLVGLAGWLPGCVNSVPGITSAFNTSDLYVYDVSGNFTFQENQCTYLRIDNLVWSSTLTITRNPNLEFFSFPNYETSDYFVVTDNPALKTINRTSLNHGNWTSVHYNMTLIGDFDE
jgi:hypothetical protein